MIFSPKKLPCLFNVFCRCSSDSELIDHIIIYDTESLKGLIVLPKITNCEVNCKVNCEVRTSISLVYFLYLHSRINSAKFLELRATYQNDWKKCHFA